MELCGHFYVAFYHSRDLKPENILLDDNGKSNQIVLQMSEVWNCIVLFILLMFNELLFNKLQQLMHFGLCIYPYRSYPDLRPGAGHKSA